MGKVLKRVAQAVAHRLGFSLARVNDVVRPDVDVLSLLWSRWGRRESGAFLQIGGNDGISFDPLHLLARDADLPGVIVEPQPHACEKLRVLWRDRPEVEVVEAAVGALDGEVPLYRFVSPDPSRVRELSVFASLDRKVISRMQFMLRRGEKLEQTKVRSISVPSLVKVAGGSIALLVVDIEGLDDQCVHAFMDQGVRPSLICYEHIHLSPRRDGELLARLRGEGYALLRTGWDTYAVRS